MFRLLLNNDGKWYLHKDGFLKHIPSRVLGFIVHLAYFREHPEYLIGPKNNPSTFARLDELWRDNG